MCISPFCLSINSDQKAVAIRARILIILSHTCNFRKNRKTGESQVRAGLEKRHLLDEIQQLKQYLLAAQAETIMLREVLLFFAMSSE